MEENDVLSDVINTEEKSTDVIYHSEKDFYKGIGGELRFKAEGLFKKAREKGISIEEISISPLKEKQAEFPGIGIVDLPSYIIKVKGRHLQSGQTMVDGKLIDYFNRFQAYIASKIESKNAMRDERGRIIRDNNKRPRLKEDVTFFLDDWERFEIGKNLVDDKEFGLEKTITGACDRVIRKLMGENDWLYPEEARLLDEEFENVQQRIEKEQETGASESLKRQKKATERQINYLKAKIKNLGLNPDDSWTIKEILRHAGYEESDFRDLSTTDMSKLIDSIAEIVKKLKDGPEKAHIANIGGCNEFNEMSGHVKQ